MRYCFDDFFLLSAFNWIGVPIVGVHNLDNQHVILTINTLLNRSPIMNTKSATMWSPKPPAWTCWEPSVLRAQCLIILGRLHTSMYAIAVWILRPMCVHMLLGRSFCSQLFFCLVPMELCFFFLWSFTWNFFRLLFLRY